tara:strand:+ start:2799 stop:3653 length:855 start_codon:yes stop_codon:yes gene_type:complete
MDKNKQQTVGPGLYLVSTPIGNMQDITLRALTILKKSNFILCEDTRRSRKLLTNYGIKSRLLPYHKFNEKKVSSQVIDSIKNNNIVSLISDAGTPAISDPGLVLVNKCINEKLKVYPIPGPSAVTAAVSVSGFDDQYLFYGFLTKKENELDRVLKNLCTLNYSIVFFIPSSKIDFYILKFKEYFPDRKILIAKEMTKIHENFIREEISSIKGLQNNNKGEFTVVISGKNKEKKIINKISESVKVEIIEMLKKYSHKDVVELISKRENIQKKTVYNFCLNIKEKI